MADTLVNIYLDDERQTPRGFLRTYTVPETIQALKDNEGQVYRLSLDHDLGETFAPGYDVLLWLEEAVICRGFIPPRLINIHSANAGATPKMQAAARKILNWYRENRP